MPFTFTYQTTPLFFFLVQGLVFSGLILRKARLHDDQSGRWLAFFVSLSCLYVVPWMCGYSGWYAKDGYREFLFFVPFQQLFLLGPVLYFYVRSLLNKQFQFRSYHHWWHFVPGLLYLAYSLLVFVYDQLLVDEYYFYADGRDKDMANWYQAMGFLSMLVYAILSFRYYNGYRKLIFRELSYADAVAFGWVRKFLIALLAILLLRFVFFLLYPGFGSFGPKWWYYLLFSGLGYYIALVGYSNTMESLVAFRLSADGAEAELIEQPVEVSPAAKASPDIEEKALDELRRRITEVMEEGRQFRNPKLTLSDLAEELSVTSKQVSRVINLGFQQNFNDFVNGYRVEAVKAAFAAGRHRERTILGVALEAGFNSKTTFNRVFKRRTGLTPLAYLKQEEKS